MPYISGGGSGGIATITAADTSVVVAGTATAKTIHTNTLDVIAADQAPAADWSNNSHKITGLANGTAATDAAAFGQLASAGALVQLSKTVRATDGILDVQSISQSYNDLVLSILARATNATTDNLFLNLNNDSTSAHYDSNATYGSGATTTSLGGPVSTAAYLASLPAANATANYFLTCEVIIRAYTSTSVEKVWTANWSFCTGVGTILAGVAGGQWHSTAAVNRVTLQGRLTANLLTGSQVIIYGRL